MYLRYLCGQRHEVPDLFSFPVAATLVHVLAAQVELELGDVDEDIEEMTDLRDDLLNSDISTNSLIGPIVTFVKTFSWSRQRTFWDASSFRERSWLPTNSNYTPTRFARGFHRAIY